MSPTDPYRQVRVFISSTFRDMQAERDHLVRFVFPKLREELLKHRIHLIDVDLRWGVTSDQNALGVCREVIDECQPRFMCMLGGRYGWVPDDQDKSITAAEIHYGVLGREAEKRGHSFFYFRDDRATAQMVEEIPGDFREPDGSDNARKLVALKKAIVDAGLDPRIYGEDAQWDTAQKRLTGLEAFGKQVHTDLLQSLKDDPELAARFTTDGTAAPDEFGEEAEQMEAFIEERTEHFVIGSRGPLLREMRTFAAADGAPNIFVLTGDPGSGKSALLAKFTRELAAQPSVIRHSPFVIPHFVGASTGSTDLRRTLRRLCHALAAVAENAEPLPLDIKELITRFQKLLAEAGAKQRVILVLDALNQFDATDGAHWLNWLPRELPPGVRIVASVIAPADGQPEHQTLAILRARPGTRMEKLEPLTEADTLAVIEGSLRRYKKRLSPEQLAALLAKPAGRLPLYVLTALEELRTLGAYEEITDRIRTLPGDARALFGWILTERLARDPGFLDREGLPCGAVLVEKFAACLGVSRHGLSPAELTALLDPGDPLGNVAALLRLLRPYLMRRGELLDFYHGQFREAAEVAYLNTQDNKPDPEKKRTAHQSVATCLQAFADPHRDGQCRDATPHALSELPHHQTRAEAWPDLIATLENIFFLEAKVTHGMAFDLTEDFTAAVDALPPDHAERERLRLLDEALRRDVHFIDRHSKDYPQGLFQCLWNSAWWYDCPEAALHYLDPVGGWKTPPPWKRSDHAESASGLLERWRREREAAYLGFSWLRTLRPPPVRLNAGQLAIFRGHAGAVTSVAFSPNGRHLVSGAWDKTLRIWDARSGRELIVLRGHEDEVTSVAFSPDGRRALSGSKDNTVRLWHTETGKCLEIISERVYDVSSVKFSPDGKQLLMGMGHQVRVRYPRRGRIEVLWHGPEISLFCEHTAKVTSVAFSPDGSRVLSGSEDHLLRLWDSRLRRTANSFFFGYLNGVELAVLRGHTDKVTSVAFSPDGELIVSGSADKTLRLWNARDGQQLTVLRGHADKVTSVAFSPDGEWIVSGSADMTLRLWNARDGQELAVFRGHENIVTCVAFSPDGHHVLSGAGEKTLRLWDVQNYQEPPVLREHREWAKTAAFSPDGERLVSGSFDNTLRLWDVRSGLELAVMRGHEGCVVSVAFSPDGRRVASGSGDNTVRLWDANSRQELVVMRGHDQIVESVAFSPDGNRLLSRSWDGTIRLWDASDGKCLEIIRGHEEILASESVGFSLDGSRLITKERDGRLRDARSGEFLQVTAGNGTKAPNVVDASIRQWRVRTDLMEGETSVEPPAGGQPVAWFSSKFSDIFAHPDGRIWAGTRYQIRHLEILQLEGG